MKLIDRGIASLALGAGFGAVATLMNEASSLYGTIGSQVVNGGWGWVLQVPGVRKPPAGRRLAMGGIGDGRSVAGR